MKEDRITTIEENKLIAEFMKTKSAIINNMYFGENGMLYIKKDLRYHFSWDWLMPVVEKVESIHDKYHGFFAVNITGNSCTIQGTNLRLRDIDPVNAYYNKVCTNSKISATYRAIVDFIKWYNVNIKK